MRVAFRRLDANAVFAHLPRAAGWCARRAVAVSPCPGVVQDVDVTAHGAREGVRERVFLLGGVGRALLPPENEARFRSDASRAALERNAVRTAARARVIAHGDAVGLTTRVVAQDDRRDGGPVARA